MTRKQYMTFHAAKCRQMIEITRRKNADYTEGSGSDDPFANFRQVEKMGVCDAEIGFLTRMSDKFSRIATFCKKGALLVKDESIEDTLLDFANYCILLCGYISDKREKAQTIKARSVSKRKRLPVKRHAQMTNANLTVNAGSTEATQ